LLKSDQKASRKSQRFLINFFAQQHTAKSGGARRDRTADLLRARQALSQLSYGPLTISFKGHFSGIKAKGRDV
jgi:hypothetical protein